MRPFFLLMFLLIFTTFGQISAQSLYTGLIYNYNSLNQEYYKSVSKDREQEHQIGRFINFKNIISECKSLEGDFIEFGTLSGFSLMWIAHIAENTQCFHKKIFGIDGFVGLPYADGGFKVGEFKTTKDHCIANIRENSKYYKNNLNNIYIKEALFNQKNDIIHYLLSHHGRKFCFIHIDCDVSQSAIEIFELLKEGDLIADQAFIAFDDFFCESSLRHTVKSIFFNFEKVWNIQEYSQTNLTKTFKFSRKN